jgi:Mn-containing catalase
MNLKKYGSNSKNIKETLDYILNRDKWHKIINF